MKPVNQNVKRIKKFKMLWVFLLVMGMVTIPTAAKKSSEKPLVQMAILLDTSNSMDGLIDQAKTQLWKIVNEMALAKKEGQSPQLEVALYEYGKSSLPASEGYLRMIVPLSVDLDRISEELFNLTTHGGSEYCGKVIQSAAQELQWTESNNHLKVIFIAGNEPFTQGNVDYRTACKDTISKGIVVNTIFCGNYQKGIRTHWKDGADLADGKYMNIDQDKKIVHIDAPQDKELAELGKKLNETYVAYGKRGYEKKMRQSRQDSNAATKGEAVMAQRSMAKASAQYSNVDWDIVDAEKEGKVKVEELDEDQLPEEMKKMSKEERKKYIEKKKKEREKIQKKINQLRKKRDKYVAAKRKQMAGDDTLDEVVIKTVREQAKQKNYKFEK
ncbi:MAG: VWA domain-containing protein [Candidatus Aminicenantes bacterium]|nr:MAG: VWA domain-containing protein [Candidatus Aminicenantes bacterium]